MTPDERQRVSDLFDRLATLEDAQRDPDAERAIRDGLAQAPNALYALVQTALLQDEALKAAHARIQALETTPGHPPTRQGGFPDSMRNSPFGRGDHARGSVPNVRPAGAPMGTPASFGNAGPAMAAPAPAGATPPPDPQTRGGSFLGTAAAAAVGVIGGSLLLDGIRSMTGGSGGANRSSALADPAAGGERGGGSPWGNNAGGDLGRQAGLDDIGRGSGSDPIGQSRGLFNDAGNREPDAADPYALTRLDDDVAASDTDDIAGFDSGFDDNA